MKIEPDPDDEIAGIVTEEILEDDPDRDLVAAANAMSRGEPCPWCGVVWEKPKLNRKQRREAVKRKRRTGKPTVVANVVNHENDCPMARYGNAMTGRNW